MSALVEGVLSVEAVRLAKPRAEVYRHGLEAAGVRAGDAMLVACHPWDVTGARSAGLSGAYVARGKPYPPAMTPPLRSSTLSAAATTAPPPLPPPLVGSSPILAQSGRS